MEHNPPSYYTCDNENCSELDMTEDDMIILSVPDHFDNWHFCSLECLNDTIIPEDDNRDCEDDN